MPGIRVSITRCDRAREVLGTSDSRSKRRSWCIGGHSVNFLRCLLLREIEVVFLKDLLIFRNGAMGAYFEPSLVGMLSCGLKTQGAKAKGESRSENTRARSQSFLLVAAAY